MNEIIEYQPPKHQQADYERTMATVFGLSTGKLTRDPNALLIRRMPEPAELIRPSYETIPSDFFFECQVCNERFDEWPERGCPYCNCQLYNRKPRA
jgi:hypothetical protein